MRLRFLLFVLALGATATAARADSVYLFTAPTFTYTTGLYSSSERITGTFVFSAPLPANLGTHETAIYGETILPVPTTFVSFTLRDGLQQIDSTTGNVILFQLATDSQGNIDAWDIALHSATGQIHVGDSTSFSVSLGFNASDNGPLPLMSGYANFASNESQAGTWSGPFSATPEPSGIVLLGTGLLATLAALRKKRLGQAAAVLQP